MRRLCHYCKLLINRSLSYLYSIISQSKGNIQTCSASKNLSLKTRTVTFQNSFFLNVICEWNKLDISIYGSTSFLSFKNTILEKIRSSSNSIFGIPSLRCPSVILENIHSNIISKILLIHSVIVNLMSRQRFTYLNIAIILCTNPKLFCVVLSNWSWYTLNEMKIC